MFYEKNTQALLQHGDLHHYLLEKLESVAPTQDYMLLPTADGHYTLQYRGVFLHDPENPKQEVQNTIDTQCTLSAARVHVILGLGLGYLLDELHKVSDGQIIVYEPDLPLLRFLLENVDLSELLASPRVWLAGFQEDLVPYVRKKMYGQYQLDILILRAYGYLLADEIPGLMEKLQENELSRIQDFKTGKHFHQKWLKQVFENLPHFAEYDALDDLVGRFAGKPALVVSRGPSLDRSIEAVKALADSTVIIAVGGAVRALWEGGVIPDFAIFYDANGMKEQVHGIPPEVLAQITFVPWVATQPYIYTLPSYGKLWFVSQNMMQYCDWLDSLFEKKHYRLEGGGTVSTIAYQMAKAMQCNPIILVGQDLAFPNNQVYAGGIPLQVNAQGKMDLPSSDTLYTAPQTMATVPGQNGETLQTLKSFVYYIRHFEDMAAANARVANPVSLYNASIGGAHIEGFTLRNLAEFIPELPAWKQGHVLPEAPALSAPEQEARRQMLQKGLQELRVAVQEAIAFCGDAQRKADQHLRRGNLSVALLQSQYRPFSRMLKQHPFVGYMGIVWHIEFRRFLTTLNTNEALALEGMRAFKRMLGMYQAFLKDSIMPWIDETQNALQVEDYGAVSALPA